MVGMTEREKEMENIFVNNYCNYSLLDTSLFSSSSFLFLEI
jgi:hypothetical protein